MLVKNIDTLAGPCWSKLCTISQKLEISKKNWFLKKKFGSQKHFNASLFCLESRCELFHRETPSLGTLLMCLVMSSNHQISEAEKNFNQSLETLREWSSQEINVGVIGQAKAGKSTLINTLLGYEIDENGDLPEGAAEVDEAGVCTTKPRDFQHPENERIKIWDLPGVDGSEFLLHRYWQTIRAKDLALNPKGDIEYDFFIIALSDVITTDANRLIAGAKKMKIKWYIVRTHIDETVRKGKKQKKQEQNIIDATRRNLITQLKEKCLEEGSDFNLYLVDGTERGKFEMPKLRDDLLTDCPEAKKLVLLKHAKENGKVVAKAKLSALQSRIPKVAAACTKRDKIPLSSFFCKKKSEQLIVEEVLLYQQTFRLLKTDIEEFTRHHAKGKGNFEVIVRNHFEGEDPGLTFIRDKADKLRPTDSTKEVENTAASIVALGVLGGVGVGVGVTAVSTGAVIAGTQ